MMKSAVSAILGPMGLALASLVGCRDSGSSVSPPATSGTIKVTLVDAPVTGVQKLNLDIRTLEIASGGNGWITLSTPNKTVDLLSLVGGVSETLASGTTLAVGHYDQMRLVLGSGNSITLADGTTTNLETPSAIRSGIKLLVNFDVTAGTTKDVWIDFDAAHSIQVTHTGGGSDKYILRPTVRAVDKIATGSISGSLTATSGGPLAGAAVMAETLDTTGHPKVVRTVYTRADGSYTLDLLPVGATYYVVSQPLSSGVAYEAKSSAGFALSAGTPTFTYHAAFAAALATGSAGGSYASVATADQSDSVDLLQSLDTGGGASYTFVVRSAMAEVAAGTETYAFMKVPIGIYAVRSTRTTLAADGTSSTVVTYSPLSLTVASGLTTTANF